MLHALLYYYSLWSYCRYRGDATRSTLLLLPVRRCYTLYSTTTSCRSTVALQENATRSTLLLLPVELL